MTKPGYQAFVCSGRPASRWPRPRWPPNRAAQAIRRDRRVLPGGHCRRRGPLSSTMWRITPPTVSMTDRGTPASFQISASQATADVLRVVQVDKVTVLGASLGHAFIAPLVNLNVGIGSAHDHRSGLGDVTITPFILGWHGKSFHAVAALDINAPTGVYDQNRMANIGRNYWNFEPVLAVAYYPKGGFTVDVKMMYDVNATNKAGNINPLNPHRRKLQIRPGISCRLRDRPAGGQGPAWPVGLFLPADDARQGWQCRIARRARQLFRPQGQGLCAGAICACECGQVDADRHLSARVPGQLSPPGRQVLDQDHPAAALTAPGPGDGFQTPIPPCFSHLNAGE